MANGVPPRGSIFGPLVLIAIGLLFLLQHRIPGFNAYEFAARYWPALLIVWGLVRLVEYYESSTGYARRGLSAGEVVLVIFIVIVGVGLTASLRLRDSDWGRSFGWNGWDPFEQTYPFSAAAQAPLPPGLAVVVQSSRGDVELDPAAGAALAATVRAQVRGDTQAAAARYFAQSQPLIRREGDHLLVLPAGNSPDPRVEADITLSLPPNTPVTVRTDHGDVRAANWRAALDLATDRGDVTASNISAPLQIHSEHGDVTVQNASGTVRVDGNGGDVSLENVAGHVVLTGDFDGDLDFSRLPAGLEMSSTRTQLTLAALPGSVDMDRGDLHVQSARGVGVQTRDKDIEIEGFQGALKIADSHGTISVASAAPLRNPLTIANHDGDVTVTLPGQSEFALDATATDGDIESDFAIPVTTTGGSAQARTQVGTGGPAVTLRTSNGTIAVRKATASTAVAQP